MRSQKPACFSVVQRNPSFLTKGKYLSSGREEGLQLMLKNQIYSANLKAIHGLLQFHGESIRLEIFKQKLYSTENKFQNNHSVYFHI